MRYYTSLMIFLLSTIIYYSCKKDLVVDDINISELTSNLEENPEILYGSWNLNQNNSKIESGGIKCEAKNIHFLNNDSSIYGQTNKRNL